MNEQATRHLHYKEIPEEGELFKRNFVHMPFEDFEGKSEPYANSSAAAKKYAADALHSHSLKFSAIIWSDGFESNTNSISINKNSAANAKTYKYDSSIGGRTIAFLENFANRVINVDAKPEYGEQDLSILLTSSAYRDVARLSVVAAANSKIKLTLLNLSSSNEKLFAGILCNINAMEGSSVEINYIHNQGKGASTAYATSATAAEKAHISINNIYVGGSITKSINVMRLEGDNSSGTINEIAYLDDAQMLDATASITNAGIGTNASADSRVVASGSATAIIKGYAKVTKGAKEAVSHIKEKGITLDKRARIEAIPMMSIEEQNVREAKHSAAVAPLNDEVVFYFLARGINMESARSLVIKSTITSNISAIGSAFAKSIIPSILFAKIEEGITGGIPPHNVSGLWF